MFVKPTKLFFSVLLIGSIIECQGLSIPRISRDRNIPSTSLFQKIFKDRTVQRIFKNIPKISLGNGRRITNSRPTHPIKGPRKCFEFCPENYAPICGNDGITYKNQCDLFRTKCLGKTSLGIASNGKCPERHFENPKPQNSVSFGRILANQKPSFNPSQSQHNSIPTITNSNPTHPIRGCDNKKKVYIGAIKRYKHGVGGDIYACGDDQLVIEKFTYDGLAPDAFFLVGTESDTPNSDGIILPHPFKGKFYDFDDIKAPILDKAYDGSQRPIVLELPTRIKVSNLKWISVWCRQYEINFGDFVIANDEPTVETTSDTESQFEKPKLQNVLTSNQILASQKPPLNPSQSQHNSIPSELGNPVKTSPIPQYSRNGKKLVFPNLSNPEEENYVRNWKAYFKQIRFENEKEYQIDSVDRSDYIKKMLVLYNEHMYHKHEPHSDVITPFYFLTTQAPILIPKINENSNNIPDFSQIQEFSQDPSHVSEISSNNLFYEEMDKFKRKQILVEGAPENYKPLPK